MAKAAKEIKQIPIAKLKLYEDNPRQHSDRQIERLAESLSKFGFLSPVIMTDKMEVVAGHGRIMAAENLKWTKVPCLSVTGLTDDEKRAYIVADNMLAEQSDWDAVKLHAELTDLRESGFDISVGGMGDFLESADFTPSEPDFETKKTTTKIGQVEKSEMRITCPHCHEEFEVSDKK